MKFKGGIHPHYRKVTADRAIRTVRGEPRRPSAK